MAPSVKCSPYKYENPNSHPRRSFKRQELVEQPAIPALERWRQADLWVGESLASQSS